MPFVTHVLRSQENIQPPFVGRAKELHLFRERVLHPDEPSTQLLSIWGPAGVGTSTLLAQLRQEAVAFQHQCLTAFTNVRMQSPLHVMTEVARQLRVAGAPLVAFEQLLDYITKMASPPLSLERETARVIFVQHVQGLAQAQTTQGSPMIGGMYEAVSDMNRTEFLQQHLALDIYEQQSFSERLTVLTRAFLDDLNWLAAAPGRGQRIILFLDEVNAESSALTWLHTQVLSASINKQVVLVLGGSGPLEPALSHESSVTSLQLHPFTEEETQHFLAAYKVADLAHITQLWQKSGGLPLMLRLLAPVPRSNLMTAEQAMPIGLRWIEQQKPGYQYLMRYAALFSRPLRPHDLAVCPVFSAQECIQWYRRLIALPFVQNDIATGEYIYHPLVQQHICLTFAEEAPPAVQQARQTLVHFYEQQVAQVEKPPNERTRDADQDITLALVEQLLRLSDKTSLKRAIVLSLSLAQQTADHMTFTDQLREFIQASSIQQPLPDASKDVAQLLLTYAEADLKNPAFQAAITRLLEMVGRQDIPATLLAHLYSGRASAWLLQGQPQRARDDSSQAVICDPAYADGYLLRGIASAALGMPTEAIADFDQAISLDNRNIFAYAHLGLIKRDERAYEQAMENINQVLISTSNLPEAALLRNLVYEEMDKAGRGLGAFDYQLERHPGDKDAYVFQAMAHGAIGQYAQALASFEQALSLDSTDPRIYAGRGHIYLERGELQLAQEDLFRSWELDNRDGTTGLLLVWVRLCLEGPDTSLNTLLGGLSTSDMQQDIALTSRGIAHILQQQFEEALAVLEQVLLYNPQYSEAAFWKGLTCAFLEQDIEALAALERASNAEIPLPTALFAPLRWIEPVRPDFYQQQLLPLL